MAFSASAHVSLSYLTSIITILEESLTVY